MCINYAGISSQFSPPQLSHYNGSAWVNATTSVDTMNHIICGSVTSLSPFALFVPLAGALVSVSPSTVALGGTITVTGSVISNATTPQTVSIQFAFSGPSQPNGCGTTTKSVMFTTPPFTLASNTSKTVSFPFRVPTRACTGTYSVVAATVLNGTAAPTSAASLTITAR